MNDPRTHLIVGAGQAGGSAAIAMRQAGFEGRIVLLGEETWAPYERPPLSKDLLLGRAAPESALLRDPSFYDGHGIELRMGTRVASIRPTSKEAVLSSGERLRYDKLLLTTGGRVRTLPCPGADCGGVFYLRAIDDALALRAALAGTRNLVVIGGGFLGLEVAAAARILGVSTTVVEMRPWLLNRVIAPKIGNAVERMHQARGVTVMTNTSVERLEGVGRVTGMVCADGRVVAADTVVVAVGITPNDELAEAAGARVEDGIVVNEFGETDLDDVYAAGDATNHFNPLLGRRLRLESWQNAQNQAIAVARIMCGVREPYAQVPWFWSDQYDVNIQLAGAPLEWDEIVFRGDPESLAFSAFYLKDSHVVGVNALNRGADVRAGQRLIERRVPVSAAELADSAAKLKDLLKRAAM